MATELLVDALSISSQRQIYELFYSDSGVNILRFLHAYLSVYRPIVLIIYIRNSNGENYSNCYIAYLLDGTLTALVMRLKKLLARYSAANPV